MDELKVLLKENDVEYSENELVIDEDGTNEGPANSTIVGLSRNTFVSSWSPY